MASACFGFKRWPCAAAPATSSPWSDTQPLLATPHRLQHLRSALLTLDALLAEEPNCVAAWQHAGYIQALLGDVNAAETSFRRAEQAEEQGASMGSTDGGPPTGVVPAVAASTPAHSPASSARPSARRRRNDGLLHFLARRYSAAMCDLAGALEAAPHDAMSAGNYAMCQLYQRNLSAASGTLEAAFRAAPGSALREPLVLALASMYELGATPSAAQAKMDFAAWVAAVAPDDLDLACTKA